MSENKLKLTIIVNGVSYEVEANENSPLISVVEKALQESKNIGQPIDKWELRDEPGAILDLHKKINDYGFSSETKLFLSLKAGIGG